MREHVKILAWLHIVLGSLTLLAALALFLIFGAGAGLAAASGGQGGGQAALVMSMIAVILFIVVGVFAVPQLVLGWGLLNGASWARMLGIVMSILSLIHPALLIGTALGVYGLVVLFDQDAREMLEGRQLRGY